MLKQPEFKPPRQQAADVISDGASQSPKRASRQTILLLGMHRSGTSVLAHLINVMGAHIGDGDELIPAHPTYNPTGFFERTDLVNTHERFLQKHGCEWNRIGRFDLDGVDPQSISELRQQLQGTCDNIDSHGRPFLAKDPRICLLLPIWHDMIAAPFHVFAVRDPRRIADSMLRSFPGMFTTHFLLAMWQKYISSALRSLYGRAVLFVSYEQMMEEPIGSVARLLRGMRKLGVHGLRDIAQTEIRALLDCNLNRSGVPQHAILSKAQTDLHNWMLHQCDALDAVTVEHVPEFDVPADAVLIELERVREEYVRLGYLMATKRQGAGAAAA